MKARIVERFKFEAAHAVIIDGKPEEIHGHTFWLEVAVEGEIKKGYVMDFLELRKIVDEIIGKLDHRNLNALFENPTTENVALWIAGEVGKKLPDGVKLKRVILWEGEENGVEFEF
ncbi:6-pyruvoyl trahydropterin synthase family protein [Thermococcus thioreducens]|uniref:6-pyruvoyl tetrahydropterin synthase n=1 Tax=Thermococcus thioreducens TaxID=277988 RepID=A0A0Q2UQX1_9EURY|nr:6-carboxytetrahydropterin synthase [Thermococcus thioreducens]ASJ12341.1 6-pyruvoyl tetrahydropterin synthase [Thermococcus thioreducens]KQH83072.1 6-pyruvoyl tetrahydropterin synthase [Thermococcus thioreducens]SEV92520.1 6-pyruvoyltetrahydropterin/6-carboxytetrahydropterin synthase [Thermococcus thioreducens]